MENLNEYISSGILELYVYGALTDAESREVSKTLKEFPEVRKEVEEIEAALQSLASSAAPYKPEGLLASIRTKLADRSRAKVVELGEGEKSSRTPWFAYIGWAASIALLIGILSLLNTNNDLREQLNSEKARTAQMEQQIAEARDDAENSRQLLAVIRDKNISRVPLAGQTVAPDAFATVYWSEIDDKAYIDAQELPEPPQGMVYQVWSLKLEPLTPTSIGLLDEFSSDENKIFILDNANESEAFGITLEPAGGSETPTMEQLYVLGAVATS